MKYRIFTAALAAFLIISGPLPADTEFRLEKLAGNLNHPWSMVFLPTHNEEPDGARLIISERPGDLRLLRGGRLIPVSGAPDAAPVGQGGLLDLALSPDFSQDSLLYLSFSEQGSGGYGTAVARGRLTGLNSGQPKLEGTEVIYRALPRAGGGRHFGSRLVFDTEGFLYVTLGERGDSSRARDPHDPYGAVLRLNPDGSIPRDNPFGPDGEQPGEGAAEIWTWGHRNPQGMAVHPTTGEIWIHEHGPRGGDEINILQKGGDYGWPLLTWGIDYDGSTISERRSAPGYVDPILYWDPSIAPSGLTFYTGNRFPEWRGNLFAGALAGTHLRRVILDGEEVIGQQQLLERNPGRIRDVRTGPDGYIYLLTDENRGGLYRIVPLR